ncbi:DUF1838 family protein [Alterisphingorhabdus coralli]|uniref:DUF1838 family protein n=1 Tax=Alterisphingorhabdus coralli TaxID=3071408 RepID=A0AA97F6M5_9SPHN|nr:DUF1838 family protein [Parasphingorhabdus sp. SCSIO 66989]WOE75374.1 DUF1838 family protein [Parasphingorhabdus sp. SCSIO 66989]
MKAHLKFAGLATIASLFVAANSAQARELDPSDPTDAVEIMKRTQCGEADNVPAVYHWSGRGYSRVRGEPDSLLFKLQGMNVRQCITVEDAERGKGYRMVSREVMFYVDPETNEILRTWDNPWTGETTNVMHVANDPVNSRASYPYSADGKPYALPNFRQQDDWLFMPFEAPLFYHNVLAGDYQDYVGNKYHAMEIFDFTMRASEVLDSENSTAYPAIAWVRVSDWLPWMKMRGRQGQMVFNATGAKLKSYDDLPAIIKDEIALNYPIYNAPPPVDDSRKNETTWTVFKKMIDEQRAKEKGEEKAGGGH